MWQMLYNIIYRHIVRRDIVFKCKNIGAGPPKLKFPEQKVLTLFPIKIR